MENRDGERYLHFIFENNNPVYLKNNNILDIVKNYPYFEINANNQASFIETLNVFLNDNYMAKKIFIIIDTNNIDLSNQRIISCMIKDKSYQALSLSDNCKIIVTGDKNNMNKELLGLLVVIDV